MAPTSPWLGTPSNNDDFDLAPGKVMPDRSPAALIMPSPAKEQNQSDSSPILCCRTDREVTLGGALVPGFDRNPIEPKTR